MQSRKCLHSISPQWKLTTMEELATHGGYKHPKMEENPKQKLQR
jgi:hypothetical protein